MNKKILGIVTVIILPAMLATFIVTGCKKESAVETTAAVTTVAAETTAAPETTEKTEIEVLPAMDVNIWDWQPGENYVTAMDENIEAFKTKFPQYANINFIHTVLGGDYWSALRATLIAKEGVPDCFGILQDQADLYDYMTDMRPIIEGDAEWLAQYSHVDSPDLSTSGKDNRVTGIAIDKWVAGIYYYRDMLEKNNLSEPITVDDYIAMVPVLEKDGIKVLSMGGDGWVLSMLFTGMVQSLTKITNPAGIIKDAIDGSFKWDDPISKTALTEFKKLYDGGVFREDELTLGQFAEAIQNFQNKKSWGFYVGATWWAGSMNPDDLAAGNIGIIPAPIPTGGEPTYEQSTGQTYGIYKDIPVEKKQVVIDFLKFLSSPEAVKIYLKNNIMPAGNVPEGVEIPNSLIKESLIKIEGARWFDPHHWISDGYDVFGDELTSVLLNNKTVDEALASIQAWQDKKREK